MGTVLCQSKESFVTSNLKMSKKISINPVNDIENSIMLLKRLPDITLRVVNPKPIFKVPESPKLNPKKINGSNNKLKTISKSKILSERQNNNIIVEQNKNSKLFNTKNLSEKNSSFQNSLQYKHKPAHYLFDNITTSSKNNYNVPIISKIPEETLKMNYLATENTHTQKTSSPNKLLKKSPNIESKNLITINPAKKQKMSSTSTSFHEVKTISNNSLITNNVENKTLKSAKDYLLMDLSSESKINIVPAFPPIDFLNVSIPKYDSFAMGISKSSGESCMHLETSQNYIGKQEINFSNNQNYEDSLPIINKCIDVSMDLAPKLVCIEESVSLDSLKTNGNVNMKN